MIITTNTTNMIFKKTTTKFNDNVSGNLSYIDNKKFKQDVQDISDTVKELLMGFEIFEKDNDVVGTDAMVKFSKDLNMVHEMSNTLKPHVLGDIVPLFSGIQDNLNEDDLKSSNGITFL